MSVDLEKNVPPVPPFSVPGSSGLGTFVRLTQLTGFGTSFLWTADSFAPFKENGRYILPFVEL